MKIAGVTAEWDECAGKASAALVLAHGAGGDFNDPLLRAIGRALAARGVAVVRFNFAYRESGRRAPGAQSQSEDCYRAVASEVRAEDVPLFLGGKSYGGRIASHIVADGFDAKGLVLLGYPLHAPGRTDKLRDAHLRDIDAPKLFVQGTRDGFARSDLLTQTIKTLKHGQLHWVEGGDHSLKVRGRPPNDVVGEVADTIHSFIERRR